MTSLHFLGLFGAVENRLFDWNLPGLFGVPADTWVPLLLGILAIVAGYWFANAIRMKDYGWKVALILVTWLVSLSIVLLGNYRLGVDLQGGVILVYQVDKKETAALDPHGRDDNWSMSGLLEVLKRRLNPDGLKEIVIRPFGPDQVEIVIPEADPAEIDYIKNTITTGGSLRFMIVANDPNIHGRLIEMAEEQSQLRGEQAIDRNVRDGDKIIGYWAKVGREKADDPDSRYRVEGVQFDILRDARTGKILQLSDAERQLIASQGLDTVLRRQGVTDIDVLMAFDEDYDIRGSDLASTTKGRDPQSGYMILFTMRGEGVPKMGGLTAENLQRKLGIVFDNVLLSAPVIQSRISEHGQITGRFTEAEVDFMVEILKSGSMPVVLYKNPISENRIGSILGRDTIEKGTYSVAASLLIVLLFTVAYYRFAGFVASMALVLNLLLTVGIMIILRAPFTLPGLAGLVLTVGMSVDANVLIFERIREELERGATFRSALRNGFDRAMVTIIDSNLTTLLTAVVLYAIGTDQVRGFGVTLILGILTSMYTAIFMARVIFEIGERKRWLSTLTMTKLFGTLNVDWVKMLYPAAVVSVIVIGIGLVATVARGKSLFDTDLVGGTSVSFELIEPMDETELRQTLAETFEGLTDEETKSRVDFSVNELQVEGTEPKSVWRVDSSLEDLERLQSILTETFTSADGTLGLKTYDLKIGEVTEQAVGSADEETDAAAKSDLGKAKAKGANGKADAAKKTPPPAPMPPESPTKSDEGKDEATKDAKKADDVKTQSTDEKQADDEKKSETPPAAEKSDSPAEDAAKKDAGKSEAEKSDAKKAEAEKKSDDEGKQESAEESKSAAIAPSPVFLTSFLLQDEKADDAKSADAAKTDSKSDSKKSDEAPAAKADDAKSDDAKADDAKAEVPAVTKPLESAQGTAGAPISQSPGDSLSSGIETKIELSFPDQPITGQALRDRITSIGLKVLGEQLAIEVDNPNWDRRDNSAFKDWTVTLPVPEEQATKVINQLKSELDASPVWQTASKIGGQVSGDTRLKAVTAILISLLGIMAYVWFRFQRLSWGIAAVAALAHDALIMLGGIAASYWLAGPLGFAGVEEFKISLPVIAAFLTLIGYSINDTIVIFDRIREIRGKSPTVTNDMINLAVNQTMSRTILTGGLTLMVVVILYFFGGPGIHAFAFALVVGVISGTYSTVFIASPLLVWLMNRNAPAGGKSEPRPMARSSA